MTRRPALRTSTSTMCHWVGVSRMSSPPRRACFAAKSSVKSGVVDDCLAFGQHGAAHRGPQPGEQLVHAERLGEVVVGAEVERFDLGCLGATPGQHDDRHRRPAPEAAHDVESVHAGSPRSRMTTSGWWRAASWSACSPVTAMSAS